MAIVLLTLGQLANGVSDAGAKEKFLDEAGRVIYTIDDDGIVSMFENSPTDLTLSVIRGSRGEMKPQVIEVTPDAVPAGASTVLKLKGKNLVGASVKFSAPGIEVGPYAGKPKALDIPIRIPPDASPGDVTVEVMTPIGHTTARFKTTEIRLGGAGSVFRDGKAPQKIAPTAPTVCPGGMVGVAAERGGFCIEIDQTFSGDIQKAEKACAMAGKRLCTASEWRTACEGTVTGSLALKKMIGDWEWTGTQIIKAPTGETAEYGASGELNTVLMGLSDCKTNRDYPTWRSEVIAGRCCK
ncbi:MAG: hypothetical protein D4R81_08455 [Nitrospiraceae bacterium]|nr:MAG: hypothetical protein D4R81_08455 [Nitrospiraceae bacterium]